MNTKEIFPVIGNGLTYVMATIQSNEILQIVEFVMSAILTIVILAYKIWHWWREAKKDGKIDADEIDELGKIIDETKDDMEGKKK